MAQTHDNEGSFIPRNLDRSPHVVTTAAVTGDNTMSFGKGALLWLIGIPLPIILLLALFWR